MKHNCEQFSEGLSLLAAGCVSEQEELVLRAHVGVCAACRERLGQLQEVSGELFGLSSPEDVDLVDVLLERVVAEVQPVVLKSVTSGSGRGVVVRGGGVFPVVVAVLLLLVLAGGLRFGAGPRAGVAGVAVVVERPLPGLLTLTMAAVESEESLDLLLDRFADPGALEPLGRPAFVQESLR